MQIEAIRQCVLHLSTGKVAEIIYASAAGHLLQSEQFRATLCNIRSRDAVIYFTASILHWEKCIVWYEVFDMLGKP